MRIKIVSDGTPQRTRILNVETGEELKGVKAVEWEISCKGLAVCNIQLVGIPVELEAEVEDGVEITEFGDEWRSFLYPTK